MDTRRDFVRNALGFGLTSLHPGSAFAATASRNLTDDPPNPYLDGNYRPVLEESTIELLEVVGSLPSALKGRVLRNGPNPLYPPTPYHLFDGDGMVHSLHFDGGKVSYRNRFILTEGFLAERAVGRSLYGGILKGPPMKNAGNTALVYHHGQLLALWEGGMPYRMDLDLNSQGIYPFFGQWPHAFTAHPKVDPNTFDMVFFSYGFLKQPYLRYGVMNKEGRLAHELSFNLEHPVMIHDFTVTTNYTLFMILPLVFDGRGFAFRPELGAKIGVLPRFGQVSDMRWFAIDPCWSFHTMSAREDGQKIHLYACRFENFDLGRVDLGTPEPHMWTIDLAQETTTLHKLNVPASEFPVMHPGFVMQGCRYTYLSTPGSEAFAGLVKYDADKDSHLRFAYPEGIFGGEAAFAANPEGSAEDDGWLISLVFDKNNGQSLAYVIDAKDMSLMATIKIPVRVPYGFHGTFVPA